MWTLGNFYQSKEWMLFRLSVINDRLNDEGITICEHCGKPIVNAYDIIAHHIEALTEDNVNDIMVSLNADNIQLVHHVCHNKIHNKLGYRERKVYLVYGAPYAGKHAYVDSVAESGDIIISMDRIWRCIGCNKDGRLNAIAFKMRDTLIDSVRYRLGKWNTAYIIGGYPLSSERQRLCKVLGAEEIYIESTMNDCMMRMISDYENANPQDYKKYINDWFEKYTRPPA